MQANHELSVKCPVRCLAYEQTSCANPCTETPERREKRVNMPCASPTVLKKKRRRSGSACCVQRELNED